MADNKITVASIDRNKEGFSHAASNTIHNTNMPGTENIKEKIKTIMKTPQLSQSSINNSKQKLSSVFTIAVNIQMVVMSNIDLKKRIIKSALNFKVFV